jgi:hypothetical protein
MKRSNLAGVVVWAVATAGLLIGLGRGLPARGFYVGDCGVKLVMMFVALEHPTTPLDVPLPRIGGQPAPDLLGRFYIPHGDHAHALTSERARGTFRLIRSWKLSRSRCLSVRFQGFLSQM